MQLFGVPGSGDEAAMSEFVEQHGLQSVPQFPDYDGRIWAALGVPYQPHWMIIRADGTTDDGAGSIPAEIVRDAVVAG